METDRFTRSAWFDRTRPDRGTPICRRWNTPVLETVPPACPFLSDNPLIALGSMYDASFAAGEAGDSRAATWRYRTCAQCIDAESRLGFRGLIQPRPIRRDSTRRPTR